MNMQCMDGAWLLLTEWTDICSLLNYCGPNYSLQMIQEHKSCNGIQNLYWSCANCEAISSAGSQVIILISSKI